MTPDEFERLQDRILEINKHISGKHEDLATRIKDIYWQLAILALVVQSQILLIFLQMFEVVNLAWYYLLYPTWVGFVVSLIVMLVLMIDHAFFLIFIVVTPAAILFGLVYYDVIQLPGFF